MSSQSFQTNELICHYYLDVRSPDSSRGFASSCVFKWQENADGVFCKSQAVLTRIAVGSCHYEKVLLVCSHVLLIHNIEVS